MNGVGVKKFRIYFLNVYLIGIILFLIFIKGIKWIKKLK